MATSAVPAPLAQLPNALTIARIVLIPVYVWLITTCDGGRSWAAAIVFSLPAAIAFASRFSGGVRISPQNTGVIAGPRTDSCQSIHGCALARTFGSFGSSAPPCLAAR